MNISDARKLGALSLINFARKHAEKCAAHPMETIKGRAAAVETVAQAAEDAYTAYRPLRALWRKATTAKDLADEAVEDEVRGISYDLLAPALLNKNRDDPRYRVLFPDGTMNFILGADRAQVAHVRGMVKVLREDVSHPMADRAARLEEKNEAFDALLAPQTNAESVFRAAETLVRETREALYKSLRKSVTFLRDQLESDEAAVDKLFPTLAEATVEEPKDDGPA